MARSLAYDLRCLINVGLLSDVDTVTWRSADAMLSSAQDYRPGCFGQQYHAWQATLDEDAVVFTTLPGNEPRPGNQTLTQGWSGTWSQSGRTVTVRNAGWNGTLATGATAQIGANFAYSGTNTDPASFAVDDVTLTVHDVVVLQDVLAGLEVLRLHLALGVGDRVRDPLVLYRDVVGDLQHLQHAVDPV